MRQLVATGLALVAVALPTAAASSGSVAGLDHSRDASPNPATHDGGPRPRLVPPRPLPPYADDDSCVLPVHGSMPGCPGDGQPPVSCVLPVSDLPARTTVLEPCPMPRRPPESRIVPVLPEPATR